MIDRRIQASTAYADVDSSWHIFRDATAGSCGNSIFGFLRTLSAGIHDSHTISVPSTSLGTLIPAPPLNPLEHCFAVVVVFLLAPS